MKKSLIFYVITVFLALTVVMVGCSSQEEGNGEKESGSKDETKDQEEVDYPTGSVEMIVPFSSGGGTDTFARTVSPFIEEELGESMTIINKPGGGAEPGMTEIAESEPDGYTLGFISLNEFLLQPGYKETTYEYEDLIPIASFTESNAILVTKPDSPFENFDEFVDYGKENPEDLTVSISGDGHKYSLLQIEKAAEIELTPVVYSGGGENFNAVLGGHVEAAVLAQSFAEQAEDQGLKVIGVTGADQNEMLPDVPTFKEMGYDVMTIGSRVLVAPNGTPDDVVNKIQNVTDAINKDDEAIQKLRDTGALYNYKSGSDLDEFVDSQTENVLKTLEGNEEFFQE